MKIYIAGPMSSLPGLNRSAFHALAQVIQRNGDVPLNPAALPAGLTEAEYMDICFAMIRAADACYFLPGWENSDGAKAEYHYAKKIGKSLKTADHPLIQPL